MEKIKLCKKGNYLTSWAEMYTILVAIGGFFLAVSIKTPNLNYIVLLVAGFLGGRLLFQHKRSTPFPYFMITFGFFVGYILGSYYVSRKLLVFFAIVGVVISYYVHDKSYI
jgi:4-hydroxybenzoate polyprenyltransferase